MRFLSKVFAALDAISIILLFQVVLGTATHLTEVPANFLSQAKVWLTFLLFISLFISAVGLLLNKKFGFITYYAQFPFRLVLWVFSFGFITLLPEWLNLSEGWFSTLFRICIVAEFFRLYYTIKIHRKYF